MMVRKKNQMQILWEKRSNRIHFLMLEKLKDIMQATDFFLTKKNEIAKQLYKHHVLKRKR